MNTYLVCWNYSCAGYVERIKARDEREVVRKIHKDWRATGMAELNPEITKIELLEEEE